MDGRVHRVARAVACSHEAGHYASFLPMNHVVEGIMGDVRAVRDAGSVEVAFVEDIQDVPDALRSIQPTVFFSRPAALREGVGRVEGSAAGRRFLACGDRLGEARPGLGWSAGRCSGAQGSKLRTVIVGSATVLDGFLARFHEIGVEVHDAYGSNT